MNGQLKNRMTQGAALGAAALLTLALAGCETSTEVAAEGAPADSYSIGFISSANNEWGSCLQSGIDAEAADQGVDLITLNSDGDAAKELANVEDMIVRGVDAILLNTVSVDALAGGMQRAKQAGIPVYLVAVMPENVDDVLGAAIVDLGGVGALAAGWIDEDAAGADVTVAVVAGAPGASSDYVVAGFKGALPASAAVVAEQPGMFNRGAAQAAAENIIQANPAVNYVFVLNEDMAFGVKAALDAAGSDAAIVTMNGTDPGLEAVAAGDFGATVADSAMNLGASSLANAVSLLSDPSGEQIFSMPVVLITAENIASAPKFCGDI